jgi:hypothetical protein
MATAAPPLPAEDVLNEVVDAQVIEKPPMGAYKSHVAA